MNPKNKAKKIIIESKQEKADNLHNLNININLKDCILKEINTANNKSLILHHNNLKKDEGDKKYH